MDREGEEHYRRAFSSRRASLIGGPSRRRCARQPAHWGISVAAAHNLRDVDIDYPIEVRAALRSLNLTKKELTKMKTMTCKQMGGPCDAPFHGNTADEVIKAEDSHLKEMVAGGDETHKSARKSMQDRWRHPVSGMKWYMNTKKAFAALPED